MLKKRVIPLLLWSGGKLRKTKEFSNPIVVGSPLRTCKVFSDQDADELILLNIDVNPNQSRGFVEELSRIASEVMMPLAAGGGITGVKDAEALFNAGADKVVVNSLLFENPNAVKALVTKFGSQAVVVCVDYRESDEARQAPILYSHCGKVARSISLREHLAAARDCGVGEIMIQSIGRDGTQNGYDFETLTAARVYTDLPLIVAGGARDFSDLKEAFDVGADAAACGSLFYFGDNNPIRAKSYLANCGVAVRKTKQKFGF